ncbi:conserved hypothetical protein [Histoplasma capsulatum H143]|uniref:Uncharacterized protein n=1 Tax=Ajellomyces capsulatus (strain H143) TaxID=544712 RepID=C6HIU4_AJECH|nr:conserved hypothetical protein [Histoplasma capsulatum H143]
MPSTLRTVQKCAFNTSAPTSPSLESSNRPDADCHATHTSIDTSSSSSSSKSENPSTVYINPHRAKRIWPPDVSKLSQKQQFRLERKYRRRAKLKWARPTWTKWTKLVQWAAIGCIRGGAGRTSFLRLLLGRSLELSRQTSKRIQGIRSIAHSKSLLVGVDATYSACLWSSNNDVGNLDPIRRLHTWFVFRQIALSPASWAWTTRETPQW